MTFPMDFAKLSTKPNYRHNKTETATTHMITEYKFKIDLRGPDLAETDARMLLLIVWDTKERIN